jgi:hypothetical protein
MKDKSARASDKESDAAIQVLKETTCPTSSGKSTLTYQVGVDESGAIHLKVSSNDGGGFFSNEWIAFAGIQAALEAWPDDQGITSMTFRKIFRGKSSNTPGFLIAVLCAEGLLEQMPKKQRVHQACDPSAMSLLQETRMPVNKNSTERTPRHNGKTVADTEILKTCFSMG